MCLVVHSINVIGIFEYSETENMVIGEFSRHLILQTADYVPDCHCVIVISATTCDTISKSILRCLWNHRNCSFRSQDSPTVATEMDAFWAKYAQKPPIYIPTPDMSLIRRGPPLSHYSFMRQLAIINHYNMQHTYGRVSFDTPHPSM
jgi:hypothetical protein